MKFDIFGYRVEITRNGHFNDSPSNMTFWEKRMLLKVLRYGAMMSIHSYVGGDPPRGTCQFKIDAIRKNRSLTGATLKDSLNYVEALIANICRRGEALPSTAALSDKLREWLR